MKLTRTLPFSQVLLVSVFTGVCALAGACAKESPIDEQANPAERIVVDAPFEMPPLQVPVFGHRTFDIRNYGAAPDATTSNTKAFAAAVEACSNAGGGTVLVPKGTWSTGPIRLNSNVNLHLAEGAVIRFSTDFDDYLPPVFTRYEGIECYNYCPPVYANGCVNVAITGSGRFDDCGKPWWDYDRRAGNAVRRLHDAADNNVPARQRIFADKTRFLRPSFIQFVNCRNVLIDGVTIGSGPMWTIHPLYCENVIIRNVTIRTKGPNNDGIDPDSCRNVLIENCSFDTADDAIALKSGRDTDGRRVGRPCENVVIRHCTFGLDEPCDGVVSIGSEMSGDVRNVYITGCAFNRTDRGIRIKSRRGRGGIVENIWIENITMNNPESDAILLNAFYQSGREPRSKLPPTFRNIHISNIRCRSTKDAVIIKGLPEKPISNVALKDIAISARYGLRCTNAKDIKLVGLHIEPQQDPVILLENSRNVTITQASCAGTGRVFLELRGAKTRNIHLYENDPSCTGKSIRRVGAVDPNAVVRVDLSALKSPILLRGDENQAFRGPAAIYHEGFFHLFYAYWLKDNDGNRYGYVATSISPDLRSWTDPRILTPKGLNLNFSSPGNVIRYNGQWVMCMQTYPTPNGEKYGNEDCRIWITRSSDLESWSQPEPLLVKGPNVPLGDIGRIIDPFLIEDKDEPGKWWCFFDDNAANISYSYDLKNWTYFTRIEAGENACVIVHNGEYLLFHSPKNGIAVKRSKDMKHWQDVGRRVTKSDTGPITLGQANWPWAKQRLTAAFVLDLTDNPDVGKYLMFFQAEPPGGFKKYASIGIAFSDDLIHWDWPGKRTD